MPVSSHLSEYYHVFNDGSTGRLAVSPWTRETLADGYWINENTIKPLSARDVFLADCIQQLSAQDPIYKEGSNVKIIRDDDDGQYIIAVDPSNIKIPKFESSLPITISTNTDENTNTYELQTGDGINTDNGKLNIDTDKISQTISHTSAVSSYMKYEKQEYTYTYSTANIDYQFVTSQPISPVDNKLYLIY